MRWVVGILLVCAAILKTIQLVSEPAVATMQLSGTWLLPIQIGAEFGVGLIVLSGHYWRRLRWPVILLFMCFAGSSLYLAIMGETSCRCFGTITIHPFMTFLLDLAIVCGLIMSTVWHGPLFSSKAHTASIASDSISTGRRFVIPAILSTSLVVVIVLSLYADYRTAFDAREFGYAQGTVILEPEQWIGQRLPIADSIDIDLSKGKWDVLLYRHDCSVCEAMIPRYKDLAATGGHVALLEVPPFAEFPLRALSCHYGRLKGNRKWFVQTPVELQLENGLVTSAKGHGE